jgi:hypothetical protein
MSVGVTTDQKQKNKNNQFLDVSPFFKNLLLFLYQSGRGKVQKLN